MIKIKTTNYKYKLYEEGNRIYDLQSYPIDDFDYINKNGQDNAVTDYPAY